MISLCKHNIGAPSTFSYNAAFLNANPDKKCFRPKPATADEVQKTLDWINANKISPSNLDTWVFVPYDFDNRPEITQRPYFSLLMVVNNDIATLKETLDSILAQDYKYYEVIIIDNASFDGSGKLCKQAAKISDKVTLIKLYDKISDGAAWNKALSLEQGKFVMFLKGNDRIFPDALTSLYNELLYGLEDISASVTWLREDNRGTITVDGKNFSIETDAAFGNSTEEDFGKFDKQSLLKILTTNEQTVLIVTKIFYRKFLLENAIRFDESLVDEAAELLFMAEAMLHTEYKINFFKEPFYVAPRR